MGIITTASREFERRRIDVRSTPVPTDEYGYALIDVLLDAVADFAKDTPDEHSISVAGDPVMIIEWREETDAELSARIEENRQHALKVQRDADRSWAKQKRKFARARNKG